jgi:hypothetical protein
VSEEPVAGRAAAAVRSNTFALPIVLVLGLIGTTLVAHTLATAALASYLVILAARGTIQFLTDLGSGTATSRAIATMEKTGAGPAALRLYLRLFALRVALILIGVALVAFAPDRAQGLLGEEVSDFALALIVVMLASEILASLGYYTLAGLLRHQQANRIAIAQGVIQPSVVVVLVAAGFGLTGAVVGLTIASVSRSVALHVLAYRALRGMADDAQHNADGVAGGLPGALLPTAVAASIGKFASFAHSRQGLSLVAASAAPPHVFIIFALGYDITHQVLTPIGTPVSTVMGPALSSVGDERRSVAAVGTATRLMLLAAFGAAGCFVIGLAYGDGTIFGSRFHGLDPYIAILAPAVAFELAVAIPLASAMLSHDRWLRAYRRIKVVTLAGVGLYFVVGVTDLVLVLAVMAAVRAASALAMAVVYQRGTSTTVVALGWYGRLAFSAGISTAAGVGAGALLGGLPGGIVGAAVYAASYVLLVRTLGLVLVPDIAVLGRVAPGAQARLERLLAARTIAAST